MAKVNMNDWDRYTLRYREHRDKEVRLHNGPHHGRVVRLPDGIRRRGQLLTPVPVKLSFELEEPIDMQVETATYQREKLAIYDEVDHAVDIYDYWHLAGAPLPPLRHG
jgi:hypothetical protein